MKRRIRRARNEPPVVPERWQPGLQHLLGAAILLSLVAAFLRSNQGVRLGLPGAFVWVMALLISFGLGLAHYAPYLLPPEADDETGLGWREGLRMLTYHFTVLMLPPSLRNRYHRPRSDVPRELSDSFAEFEAGFVPSHLALILSRGASFARAAGPGYVRLHRGERIRQVLDLRRQVRREDVEAFTRDGIALNTSVAVTFRVREPESEVGPDIPFAYNPSTVFRLTYSDGVGLENEIRWSERIAPQAAALVVSAVAQRRLDHFYHPNAPDPADALALNELVSEVKQELIRSIETLFDCRDVSDCPIAIHSVTVGHLQPPPEVVHQRILNWQSAWERRKIVDRAASMAYEISEIQRVRGDTLRKLILDVTYNVAELANGDRETMSKVLLVRIAEMIDRLIGDQRVKLQTPQEIFEALHKARRLLGDSAGEEKL